MNTKLVILLIVAASAIGTYGSQTVFGQSVQIIDGVSFSTEEVIFLIGVGAIAGAIRAWQGYDKSPNDFDFLHFIQSVRDATLIAIPVAFTAALGFSELNAFAYVLIFFSIWGATSAVQNARLKSIPSNASNEEIARILEERG